jgi:hypothetical protein
VVPIFNYFQAALVLYGDGLLTAAQVLFVAREMLSSDEYSIPTLANSLQDLLRRGRATSETALRLTAEIETAADGAGEPEARSQAAGLAAAFSDRVRELRGAQPIEHPAENPRLDYVALVDAEFQHRREKRRLIARLLSD